MFSIGYTKELEHLLMKRASYIARCESCKHYGADNICTNKNVTSFDITDLEGRVFCSFWQPESAKE